MRKKLVEYLLGVKMRGDDLVLEDSLGAQHTITWDGNHYMLDGKHVFSTEKVLCDILIHEGIIYRVAR